MYESTNGGPYSATTTVSGQGYTLATAWGTLGIDSRGLTFNGNSITGSAVATYISYDSGHYATETSGGLKAVGGVTADVETATGYYKNLQANCSNLTGGVATVTLNSDFPALSERGSGRSSLCPLVYFSVQFLVLGAHFTPIRHRCIAVQAVLRMLGFIELSMFYRAERSIALDDIPAVFTMLIVSHQYSIQL